MDKNFSFAPARLLDAKAATSWITSKEALLLFAGPGLTYPMAAKDLLATTAQGWNVMALRIDNVPRGIACYTRRSNDTVHLGRILVDPQGRGLGLGRSLVEHLVKHVTALSDVRRVTLNVYEHNDPAVNLYSALGFVVTETVAAIPSGGWATLRMQLAV
ncbi:GNAT family N-acetyltransferase [Actinomycetes bacterium M1A6_2h]|uniref:GNAT family N-acetyltransferase n=1 Tax=Kocuria rhizophila TaxID=72000 RepID=UPI0011A13C02|nr:GNAT family N-acetyltransferase [Kocuria rhizophila]